MSKEERKKDAPIHQRLPFLPCFSSIPSLFLSSFSSFFFLFFFRHFVPLPSHALHFLHFSLSSLFSLLVLPLSLLALTFLHFHSPALISYSFAFAFSLFTSQSFIAYYSHHYSLTSFPPYRPLFFRSLFSESLSSSSVITAIGLILISDLNPASCYTPTTPQLSPTSTPFSSSTLRPSSHIFSCCLRPT